MGHIAPKAVETLALVKRLLVFDTTTTILQAAQAVFATGQSVRPEGRTRTDYES